MRNFLSSEVELSRNVKKFFKSLTHAVPCMKNCLTGTLICVEAVICSTSELPMPNSKSCWPHLDRWKSYHIIGHSALPCISWGSFFDQTHACFGIGTFNTRWWNILTDWKIMILKCHCKFTHRLCLGFSRCIWLLDLIKCHAYLFCRSVVFTVFLERESGCEFRWRGGQTTSAAAANPAAADGQLAASST